MLLDALPDNSRRPSTIDPHQVNPAAGTVVLVARFEISRASGRAQSAMHAVQEFFVLDVAADARGAGIESRRRSVSWGSIASRF